MLGSSSVVATQRWGCPQAPLNSPPLYFLASARTEICHLIITLAFKLPIFSGTYTEFLDLGTTGLDNSLLGEGDTGLSCALWMFSRIAVFSHQLPVGSRSAFMIIKISLDIAKHSLGVQNYP